MGIAIPKKHTPLRMKLKFSGIVRSMVWPAGTPKGSEKCVIRFVAKKTFKGSFIIDDSRWETIGEEDCHEESFIP